MGAFCLLASAGDPAFSLQVPAPPGSSVEAASVLGGAQRLAAATSWRDDEVVVVVDGRLLGLGALGESGSASPAQIVAMGFRRHQEDVLLALGGEYALVIATRDKLIAARGGLGLRPLFVAQIAGRPAVSSAPSPLFAAGLPRRPDPAAVARFLAGFGAPLPWLGLSALPPGEARIFHLLTRRTVRYRLPGGAAPPARRARVPAPGFLGGPDLPAWSELLGGPVTSLAELASLQAIVRSSGTAGSLLPEPARDDASALLGPSLRSSLDRLDPGSERPDPGRAQLAGFLAGVECAAPPAGTLWPWPRLDRRGALPAAWVGPLEALAIDPRLQDLGWVTRPVLEATRTEAARGVRLAQERLLRVAGAGLVAAALDPVCVPGPPLPQSEDP